MLKAFVAIVSLVIGLGRIYLLNHPVLSDRQFLWFRDTAHIWCGILIGALFLYWKVCKQIREHDCQLLDEDVVIVARRWMWIPLVLLIIVEVACGVETKRRNETPDPVPVEFSLIDCEIGVLTPVEYRKGNTEGFDKLRKLVNELRRDKYFTPQEYFDLMEAIDDAQDGPEKIDIKEGTNTHDGFWYGRNQPIGKVTQILPYTVQIDDDGVWKGEGFTHKSTIHPTLDPKAFPTKGDALKGMCACPNEECESHATMEWFGGKSFYYCLENMYHSEWVDDGQSVIWDVPVNVTQTIGASPKCKDCGRTLRGQIDDFNKTYPIQCGPED